MLQEQAFETHDFLSNSFLLLTTLFAFLQYVENKWLSRIREAHASVTNSLEEINSLSLKLAEANSIDRFAELHIQTSNRALNQLKNSMIIFERSIQSFVMPFVFVAVVALTAFFYGMSKGLLALLYTSELITGIALLKGLLDEIRLFSDRAVYVVLIAGDLLIPILSVKSGIIFWQNRSRRRELEQDIASTMVGIVRTIGELSQRRRS